MSGARTLRIGTRASALALWQANRVADLIRAQSGAPAVELVHIRTEGDMRTDVPLWAVDGRAFFTKEIDRALLANEIDIAVHSLKDLSTVLEEGTDLVAVVERQDPRDAFLSREGISFAKLPAGSARRHEQLAASGFPEAPAAGYSGDGAARERAHASREDAEGRVRRDHSGVGWASCDSGWTSTSPNDCRRSISRRRCRRVRLACVHVLLMLRR